MHLRAMMRDGMRTALKSRPEIGPGDAEKADSEERVSGSVGIGTTDLKANEAVSDKALRPRELPSDPAGVAEIVIEVLRRLGKL